MKTPLVVGIWLVTGKFGEVATQIFFIFTPSNWEMIPFDSYFSDGLEPPTSIVYTHYMQSF